MSEQPLDGLQLHAQYHALVDHLDKVLDLLWDLEDFSEEVIREASRWLENLSTALHTWAVDIRVRDGTLIKMSGCDTLEKTQVLLSSLQCELEEPREILKATKQECDGTKPSMTFKNITTTLFKLQDLILEIRESSAFGQSTRGWMFPAMVPDNQKWVAVHSEPSASESSVRAEPPREAFNDTVVTDSSILQPTSMYNELSTRNSRTELPDSDPKSSLSPGFAQSTGGAELIGIGPDTTELDVNEPRRVRSQNSFPPIHVAALEGHVEIVQLLLGNGVQPDDFEANGVTPLWLAAQEGHFEIVKMLHEAGASLNTKSLQSGRQPLHQATQNGHIRVFEYLLAHGAEPNQADKDGKTPLWLSAKKGDVTMVAALLARRAGLEATDYKSKRELLHQAAQGGHEEVLHLLLEKDVQTYMAVVGGATLSWLAVQDQNRDFVLNTDRSSACWAQIAVDNYCPDVEVCVRVRGEVQRMTLRNSDEIRTNLRYPTNKPRAFRITSLAEILINLAFCIYLIDEVHEPSLSFDSRVFDLHDGKDCLFSNPTILQLLLHQEAFISMNRLLLSPDGKFMFDDNVAFLRQAIISTNAEKQSKLGFEYSSANHIFAALLLQQLTGLQIDEVLYKYIFLPFGMTHTTLSKETIKSLVHNQEIELLRRYEITHRSQARIDLPEEFQYMSNSMEKAFLGAWSTADDLDKMFVQLMQAYHNRGSPEDQVLSQKAAQKFFEAWDGHSLAGVKIALEDELSPNESPNKSMRHQNGPPLYNLRQVARSDYLPQLHYKGSAMTGAASTLCMEPKEEVFIIVLANLAAPVDVTPHITNLFLQDVYSLHPYTNIVEQLRNQRGRATALFNDRGKEDLFAADWPSTDFQKFVGVYRGVINGQNIVISEQQTMVIRRQNRASGPLPVRSAGDTVRIVPKSFNFILDRHREWSDVEFKLERNSKNIMLRTSNGHERYIRDP